MDQHPMSTAAEGQPMHADSSTRSGARSARRLSRSPPPRQRRRSRSRDSAASESGEERRARTGSPSRLRTSHDAAAPEANEAWAALVASGKVPSTSRLPASSSWSTLPSSSSLASIVSASAADSQNAIGTPEVRHQGSSARMPSGPASEAADKGSPSALTDTATSAVTPDRKRKSNSVHSSRASPSANRPSSPLDVSGDPFDALRAAKGDSALSDSTAARSRSSQGQRVASTPNPTRGHAASPGGSARRSASPGRQRGPDQASVDPVLSRRQLTPERREREAHREPLPLSGHKEYSLTILQQPQTGCAFGSNLLARVAVGPPLILQVSARDEHGAEVSILEELPLLTCQVRLLTEHGQTADMLSPVPSPRRSGASASRDASTAAAPDRPPGTDSGGPEHASSAPSLPVEGAVRMLYGTLASNPQALLVPAEPGSPAAPESSLLRAVCIFPEICIRSRGFFKLEVSLLRTPLGAFATQRLAQTSTEAFEVVLAGDFQAPPITDLTRHFARQGASLLLPPGAASE